jgi:hypothetical protein
VGAERPRGRDRRCYQPKLDGPGKEALECGPQSWNGLGSGSKAGRGGASTPFVR